MNIDWEKINPETVKKEGTLIDRYKALVGTYQFYNWKYKNKEVVVCIHESDNDIVSVYDGKTNLPLYLDKKTMNGLKKINDVMEYYNNNKEKKKS